MDMLAFLYVFCCIFLAAIARGYTGFGFSLLAITSLSLMFPVAEIVPSIFMMEVVASISLLPSIWKDIHWRALGLLGLGCLVGTPFGVCLLVAVPPGTMKIALCLVVLGVVALMRGGYQRKSMPSTTETLVTGAASGLLNGAFGIGGPPVILFFFNSPAGTDIGRASIIAFFLATDILGLIFLSGQGLVTTDGVLRFAMLVPALAAGVWIGARGFKSADPVAFRAWTMRLLVVLALLIGFQGLMFYLGK
jgi:uncharacterized membrane protein YfcA